MATRQSASASNAATISRQPQPSPKETKSNTAAKAAVLSGVFWGLGQLFNRQYIKGILLMLLEAVGLIYLINYLPRAVWGIYTLGETPSQMMKVGKLYKMVPGDHSIHLIIKGLITLLVLFIFVWVYVLVVRDAHAVGRMRTKGDKPNNFLQTLEYVKEQKFAYLFLALPTAAVLFFTIMPIIFMILLAFTNYSAPEHIPPAKLVDWVGFQNFKDLLQLGTWSGTFYGVLAWTIIWAILATVTCYFGGILVALLVQQSGIRFKTMWRTIFIIPYAIPQMLSFLIMRNMFNGEFGPINQYLSYFGLGKLPWLSDPFWAKVTVLMVNMWVGIPVTMVLVIGILTTIPKDMYEAADVDGATAWHKFKAITMPMITYSTAPILIGQFAGNINNFNVIFLMTNGNPPNGEYQYAGSTDLLVTWLYKLTLDNNKFNMAAAIGIIIFIIVASLSIWSYRRTRSFREEDMIQ
ncbi:sugar ABC transporter permease [Paenibacillus sp. ACRRX]|uniref:carbohydrate ABC transporter permease n=1 Tax=unclassified Paenibacillus TaxID=185978 RepID=UPI001EF70293|nr:MULTISPECIES: sugar ABC transporter permease [unclassified Paenibacillus]MCG7407921.1 sugar ABC transporter permease [Paenibacillus sp. ACRRX]MDK8181691.1 sugar ABC transporter permease [Paenibacillus sp. UMB4589-SE434]